MFRCGYSVSLCCSAFCLCVNVYCTAATGCQPNCSFIYIYIILHHCNALKLFSAFFNASVKCRDAITFTLLPDYILAVTFQ